MATNSIRVLGASASKRPAGYCIGTAAPAGRASTAAPTTMLAPEFGADAARSNPQPRGVPN